MTMSLTDPKPNARPQPRARVPWYRYPPVDPLSLPVLLVAVARASSPLEGVHQELLAIRTSPPGPRSANLLRNCRALAPRPPAPLQLRFAARRGGAEKKTEAS